MRSVLCNCGIPSSVTQLPWSSTCSVLFVGHPKVQARTKEEERSGEKKNFFLQISKEREKVELLQASRTSRQDFLVSSCHPYCSFSWCECMEFGRCLKADELIKLALTVLFLLLNNESKTPKNKKTHM